MTTESKPKLNPRLEKILSLIPPCRCVADIGTDHAYIPIYALTEGKADCAIASDINRGPIDRAQKNAKVFGLEERISLRLGSGLKTVSLNEADVIVIAGMGGILIADILEQSKEIAASSKYLILQPMTAAKELREYLCKNSFTIEKEVLVSEDEKIYNIFFVRVGGRTEYSLKDMILGKDLNKTSPELYPKYFSNIERKLKTRFLGLKSSALAENQAMAEEIKLQIRLINE